MQPLAESRGYTPETIMRAEEIARGSIWGMETAWAEEFNSGLPHDFIAQFPLGRAIRAAREEYLVWFGVECPPAPR